MTRRARIHYSAAEMRWLDSNRSMVIGDYHAAFRARFSRADVSAAHLHGLRKRRGWKVGRAPGRLAGRSRNFSAAEIVWLKANCQMMLAEYHRSFCGTFGRSDVTADQLRSLRKRRKWKTGRTGRFEKGAVPPNKGKRCELGRGGRHPNARRTQFKKGNLPHNTHFLYHERISTDGYVEISIDETDPHTGFERRYALKHHWLWVQANGPLPNGMALKCLDGNRLNTDPSNWEAVPRALLPRLNGGPHKTLIAYDDAPAELKPTIMTVAKLEHQLREKRQRRNPARRTPANMET